MLIVSVVASIIAAITLRVIYERGNVPTIVVIFFLSFAAGVSAPLDGWLGAVGRGVMITVFAVISWGSTDARIREKRHANVRNAK